MKIQPSLVRSARISLLTTAFASVAWSSLPAQEPLKPVPATVEEYLGDSAAAGAIIAEYKGNTYGFFINNRGVIKAIHDSTGKILFDNIGDWVLQRNGTEHAGWVHDRDCNASVTEAKEGGNQVFTVETLHPKVVQKTKIVCRETGPDITVNFEIVDFADGAGMNFPVSINGTNVQALKPDFKDNPAIFSTKEGGTITVGYNTENFSPFGNKGNGIYVPSEGGMTFYPRFGGSKEAGAKDSLTLDIQLP